MNRTPLRLAYLGFTLLGLAVIGAFFYDHRPIGNPPAPDVSRAPTPDVRPDGPPAVPDQRPLFSLKDLNDRTRSIAEWDGHALIVNFWATWCAPCRHEIPLLNSISAEYADKNIKVVGIAVDFAEDVKKFIARVPLHYDLLIGEEDGLEAARGFGVDSMAFPFTAFTDQRGQVLAVHLGELHGPQLKAALAVMDEVNRGQTPIAKARTAMAEALKTPPPDTNDPHRP
jgi:thiol-disulfide isomerase/thioredoxin